MRRFLWNGGGVALAGVAIDDRRGHDVVSADFCSLALVFAAAQLASARTWTRCHSVRIWRSPSFIVASARMMVFAAVASIAVDSVGRRARCEEGRSGSGAFNLLIACLRERREQ